jgi:serine/threonine-protein kinase
MPPPGDQQDAPHRQPATEATTRRQRSPWVTRITEGWDAGIPSGGTFIADDPGATRITEGTFDLGHDQPAPAERSTTAPAADLFALAVEQQLIPVERAEALRQDCASLEEMVVRLRGEGLGEDRIGDLIMLRSRRRIPRIIGGYRLIQRLGEGGFGVVFRAEQLSMGRDVALKVLTPARAAHRNAGALLWHEARLAGSVNHPHVVTVFDIGQAGDRRFVAMELMTHGDAKSLLGDKGGRLDPVTALRLAVDACKGLGGLATAGLVHCDIKPQNIFLAAGQHAKLGDLGLARRLNTPNGQGAPIGGSVGYLAPEQLEHGRLLDARTDLFALGCVLYECLTGERAFGGGNMFAVQHKVLTYDPTPVAVLHPEVPAALSRLTASLLARDPAERPRSAGAVLAVLDALRPRAGARRRTRAVTHDDVTVRDVHAAPTAPADTPRPVSTFAVVLNAPTASPCAEVTLRAVIASLAGAYGATVEPLGGHTYRLALHADDRAWAAMQAARLALATAERLPTASLCLTGGPPTVATLPPWLRDHRRGVVRIDDASLAALPPRFRVARGGGVAWLLEERS